MDLTFIPLDDPTNTKPWYDADIEVLCRAAADARKLILAGKKVAFLCKAGLNRSPTLATMASHGMKVAGVAMPVDEALCELALCDLEDPLRWQSSHRWACASSASDRVRTLKVILIVAVTA